MSGSNGKTLLSLAVIAVGMLGLGFASKPLYDTFCKVTGYGGTTRVADVNDSDVIDRTVKVSFDTNVSGDLPWAFTPDQTSLDVQVGKSTYAFYKVKNESDRAITGVASFNVTPIKAAPYFIKTECFCFTDQLIEAGQEVSFPVFFFVDAQIDDEKRLKDVKDITLSYTFFEADTDAGLSAAQGREALN